MIALMIVLSLLKPDTIPTVDEVIVRAKREPIAALSGVKVITDTTLKRAKSPDEILKNFAGLYVSYSGKMGADLMIHGFDTREISILVDGIPVSLPYDGTFDISQLPVSDLSAVKIYKGVGADLFGPNAMGGAVNFVTLSPFSGVKTVSFGVGRNLDKFASLTYSFVGSKIGVLLSAGYARSDGFYLSSKFSPAENEDGGVRDNSWYKKGHLRLKIGYNSGRLGNFYVNAGFINNSRGVPTRTFGRPRYWKFPVWQEKLLKFSHEYIGERLMVRSNLYYDGFYNVLKAYRDPDFTVLKWSSTYDDYTIGTNFYVDSRNLSMAAGLKKDVHRERGDSNEPWNEVKGLNGSLGLNAQTPFHGVTFAYGASFNFLKTYAQESRTLTAINPSFGVTGELSSVIWKFSVAIRSRFPTLKELYSSRMGRYYPNPDLHAERSLNLSLGFSKKIANFTTELNFFDSELKDMIDRVKVDSLYQMQNINRARYSGAELSAKNGFINLEYTLMRARNLSPERKFDELEYRPEHKLNLGVSIPFVYGVKLHGELDFVGKRYYIDRDSLKSLPPYTVFNLSFSRSIGRAKVDFYVDNLFDANYESEAGYPMPGRYYRFNITVNLD